MNICLVSANDVMEHFAFPGNKDFAADDQGTLHVLFMNGYCVILIVCETMFTTTELQTQQVPGNPRRGRFSIETPLENAD